MKKCYLMMIISFGFYSFLFTKGIAAEKSGKKVNSAPKSAVAIFPEQDETTQLAKKVLFLQVETGLAKEVARFQNLLIPKLIGHELSDEQKKNVEEKIFCLFREQFTKEPLPSSISIETAQKNFLWLLSLFLAQESGQQIKEKWEKEWAMLPFHSQKMKEWKEKILKREFMQQELEKETWHMVQNLTKEKFYILYRVFFRLEEMDLKEKENKETQDL